MSGTSESGRVWLITGATSGFGRALTEAVVAAGDTVVGAARSPSGLDDLVAAHPGRVSAVQLDVTDTGIRRVLRHEVRRPRPRQPGRSRIPGSAAPAQRQ